MNNTKYGQPNLPSSSKKIKNIIYKNPLAIARDISS